MTLLQRLSAARNRDGGWPYAAGKASRLEPTCWGLLALSRLAAKPIEIDPLMRWPRTQGWLIDLPGAPINYAFNALAALSLRTHRDGEAEAVRIAGLLLAVRGVKLPQGTEIRQDNSLQGWPWIDSTFSWLEPTGWCVLLMKLLRNRLPAASAGERIAVGERMIIDRACVGGGWNYGGSNVYGQELFAYVPTTAIGLLALQDRRAEPVVTRGLDWMRKDALTEPTLHALAMARIAAGVYQTRINGLDERLMMRLEEQGAGSSLGFAAGIYATTRERDVETTFAL